MLVIGIDPSLSGTGVARVNGTLHTIKTAAKEGDGERLLKLYRELTYLMRGEVQEGTKQFILRKATFAVIEDLPTHAMSAGLTGRAQGIVRMTLAQWDTPYVAIPPATLKKVITGKGNAKKEDMRKAMFDLTGIDNADDNQVDAWGLRQIGLIIKTGKAEVDIPDVNIQGLWKIKGVAEHGNAEN